MEVNLDKFEKVVTYFFDLCREPDEEKNIGENISPFPELKVIFDGYGYNEETDEDDDESFESYTIFIHKDLDQKEFKFPEHETTAWAIIQRPFDEICFNAQFDVNEEFFHMNYDFENSAMSNEQLNVLINYLEEKYLD